MKFLEKIDIAQKILQAIVLKRRFPLVVSWALTYRCNLRCKYCSLWKKNVKELNTKDIFCIIDELVDLGTRFIIFDGGEALLREDIAEIIEYSKNKNIYIVINSNATRVKKEIKKIQKVDEIQLSLDGPKHIHNLIRGSDVHDAVIEAIDICKKKNIKVNINTVISKENISHISYVLKIAEKYNAGIYFQPALQNLLGDSYKSNPLSPNEQDYKKVIEYLIKEKRKGCKFINNSIFDLRHIYQWPKPTKIFCLASLVHCYIQPDGKIFICDRFPNYQKFAVPIRRSFKEAFDNLSLPYPCEECWCGSMIEFNSLGRFRIGSIIGMWRRFR